MPNELAGQRIAVLATDGVEEVEYTTPRAALENAGARVELISIKSEPIQAMRHMDKSATYPVDRLVRDADPADYDGLLLPGGVANPDSLRMDPDAVRFVRAFFDAGKPIASICHGPWMLVEADIVRGRTVTSYPSLRTDIENAGGKRVDEEVHVEGGIVTSRNPGDLPAFCAKMIEELAEGRHPR